MGKKFEGKNKRGNYFIDKDFQSKYIFRFSMLVVAAGILSVVLLYFLTGRPKVADMANFSVIMPKPAAESILPILIQVIAVVAIIAGLATAIAALFISHKIAGPMYRFKKVIQSLAEGDFSSEFNIRSSDQMGEIAGLLNSMIRANKLELTRLRAQAILLKNKIESIPEKDVPQHLHGVLHDAKRLSTELETTIRFFKI